MKIQKFSEIYYVPKSDNPTSVSTKVSNIVTVLR